MEPLQTPPETSSFVLLADHQSRTPSSFHSGPAVLHYHSKHCKLSILEHELQANPVLNSLRSADATTTANGTEPQNGSDAEGKEIVIDGVDVWVTSDKFLLYNPTHQKGLSIPYPSISLHAVQRLTLPDTDSEVQGLYMQIALPEQPGAQEDDFEECITLTVVPPPESQQQQQSEEDNKPDETPTQALYNAVSACSNLHPDPMSDDEDEEGGGSGLLSSGLVEMGSGDGGLPPPMDGSSGWITADNMHEFFDEEGNWIGGGEEPTLSLGPGAGTVRAREGEDGDGDEHMQEEEETKWRRTD
ncbi:regulator of volume decrease after cellular swelling-domain-containing protein [Aspergillus pseudonomiae]|uniref:Regulator of volume decrease after cellular swelling-domain-containing protein n=1 Tax=Aspergillus pseudonomiae TaxID=1506151 RepID=A0A5N7D7J3_9EURO|nr:regulator of volume decrease after cellular swelling-domain-containing protein [Aspergillus pseudonomiae]KAE8402269.1 regulator of volume decrease after cellular swelling-domain-containing protein [Aspergillus pseudonomiae]